MGAVYRNLRKIGQPDHAEREESWALKQLGLHWQK